jgi:hypothetical protein
MVSISLLLSLCTPAAAAIVRCAADGNYGLIHQSDEWFAQRWPSGVRPSPETCAIGFIFGHIDRGDYQRVLEFYRANHPFLSSFKVVSPGGNVSEAIKIGRLFRKYLISVTTPLRTTESWGIWTHLTGRETECHGIDCICASACALISLGSVRRVGAIGLHRIRIVDPTYSALKPQEASKVYNEALAEVRQYLNEMEVPKQFIEMMVNTSSSDITWVNLGDKFARPPSLAEWEDANCPPLSGQERSRFDAVSAETKRTPNERAEYEALFQRKFVCSQFLLSRSRDSLPPP